jgi:hypothetical protein
MSARKIVLLIALILIIGLSGILLTSCAAARYLGTSDVQVEYEVSDSYYPTEEYAQREAGQPAPDVKVINGGGVGEVSLRHVIRSGSIDLAVRDTRGTIKEVRAMVTDAGGIISNSYIYEIREGLYGAHLTLRVPEKSFDKIMEQLETYGKATNVQTSLDDVTMQYVDLESRLKNQQAQEDRLVEILEMAETVEEVLEVEREIFRIRGDIEAMTAQLTYLQDQVSYATINLSLREETIPTESISPGAFDNFGQRIAQAFIGSVNFILNAVSFIVLAFTAILPVLIVLGLVALVIILLIRKSLKRKESPASKDSAQPKKE